MSRLRGPGLGSRESGRTGSILTRGATLGVIALLATAAPAFAGWSPLHRMRPTGALTPTAVSCASSTFCVAVDSQGDASTWNGSTWSAFVALDPGTWLTSVSCPSSSHCVAVGFGGQVMTFSHGSWSAPTTIGGGQNLFSVSCPSSTFCAAAGAQSVLVADHGKWHTASGLPAVQYESVSCSSSTFCLAVNASGETVAKSGQTWHRGSSTGMFGPFSPVSCVSRTFCAVVGEGGLGASAAAFNGQSWSPVPVEDNADMTADALSCASRTFCMAGGYDSNVPPGTDIAPGQIWQFDGTTFHGTVSDRYPIAAVSCPSTAFCLAIDGRGNFLTWTSSGQATAAHARAWRAPRHRARTGRGRAAARRSA